jgi:hypothetical protein
MHYVLNTEMIVAVKGENNFTLAKGCATFYGKGLHPLLWDDSQAPRGKHQYVIHQ